VEALLRAGPETGVTVKRKLIEVALPLEAINRESAREKSIRHGHPSTLHLWWARRPLAACRAIIFASYVDDPSAHPDRFPTEETQKAERERLFRLIEDLVKWENIHNPDLLKAADAEIRLCCGDDPPPVYDPFCGGGSIPLEAQRLGLSALASDLNPVAVLITKALVEIPPQFSGQPPVHLRNGTLEGTGSWKGVHGLAEDVRHYGKWMRDEAMRRIGHLYPRVTLPRQFGGGEATVIAWIWARTVTSPNPAWDGPMPLVRSFALSTKKGKETWVKPIVDRPTKRIRFDVRTGPGCRDGTVGRAGAVCIATGTPVSLAYIKEQGASGRMTAQLMAIVAEGPRGRVYVESTPEHERAAESAAPPTDFPDFTLSTHPQYMGTPRYGLTRVQDLFTARQLLALSTFGDLASEVSEVAVRDGAEPDYARVVATYLTLAVSRLADSNNALCSWSSSRDQTRNLFARQAIPMVWDFVENNPFGAAAGDLEVSVASVARAIEGLPASVSATVRQLDAREVSNAGPAVYVTDPPYYDNVPYADLSDFFYVWLRRPLKHLFPDVFSTLLVPKAQELVADIQRHGSREAAKEYFESGMATVFEHIAETQAVEFPVTIIYAFKQAEGAGGASLVASTGWETMLDALISAGLAVVGTWPLSSERGGRMREIGSNALASSVALVCRPRPVSAALATRKEFLAALKAELPGALRHMQQGSIAPVDLAQAAIGPGMAVFSRYLKVVEADGSAMSVRTALGLINQVLDETLAEQEADFDADTRWAVAWFEQYGVNGGPFGVAETLSKAKNTAVSGLVGAGILESRAGRVRLLDRTELSEAWDPGADGRLTVWEIAQYLILSLQSGGEIEAGALLR
jgi:putative DNA methylase